MTAHESTQDPQNCPSCGASFVPLQDFYTERTCDLCGKTINVVESGKGGRGIQVREGDRVKIAPGAFRLSLDPEASNMRFTRAGLRWYLNLLLLAQFPNTPDNFDSLLENFEQEAVGVLTASDLLRDLDLSDEGNVDELVARLERNRYSNEQWALVMEVGRQRAGRAIAANDARGAAWAAALMSTSRAMLIFIDHIEKLVWQGYRVERLRDALRLWEAHRENANEQFWQEALSEHAIVLSHLFAYPVILLGNTPYVGGTRLDNTGGKKTDFLVAHELTSNVAIVEIKTPAAKLVSGKYRKFPNVSRELVGSVIQALRSKDALLKDIANLRYHSDTLVDAVEPACIVIAGTLESKLIDPEARQSLELYRRSLQGVQVVTFDELFGRVRHLLSLLEDQETELP